MGSARHDCGVQPGGDHVAGAAEAAAEEEEEEEGAGAEAEEEDAILGAV